MILTINFKQGKINHIRFAMSATLLITVYAIGRMEIIMQLFDQMSAIKLVLENKNEYVRLATLDLAKDFARVSTFGVKPEICDCGKGIVIAVF